MKPKLPVHEQTLDSRAREHGIREMVTRVFSSGKISEWFISDMDVLIKEIDRLRAELVEKGKKA